MNLTFEEKEKIRKIIHHMNENHLREDGEPEKEWTEKDVICIALHEGVERIMRRHNIN